MSTQASQDSLPKVGVIGLGRVGSAVCELFDGHFEVVGWDRAQEEPYPAADLAECLFAVICVDTPTRADGHSDLSMLEEAIDQIPCQRLLVKSTVPPGSTARLREETGKAICFWPEYVGESKYHNPYFPSRIVEVPFVVLGGEPADRRWFIDRLLPILGPSKQYFQCDSTEAELIKYAENVYFATKITFVNEYRKICEQFEADWHTVREGWLLDPRVEPMHTAAFEEQPGFAGKCLPKDLHAIVTATQARGFNPALLAQVLESNGNADREADPR
ncbi:MAG TPA: hypothetical protein VFT79_05200 [Solirubrobacterales bacterium]|nr:hypothetical protein [Solirubrobacterales bacterium]